MIERHLIVQRSCNVYVIYVVRSRFVEIMTTAHDDLNVKNHDKGDDEDNDIVINIGIDSA